jgi:hypothetical protein
MHSTDSELEIHSLKFLDALLPDGNVFDSIDFFSLMSTPPGKFHIIASSYFGVPIIFLR